MELNRHRRPQRNRGGRASTRGQPKKTGEWVYPLPEKIAEAIPRRFDPKAMHAGLWHALMPYESTNPSDPAEWSRAEKWLNAFDGKPVGDAEDLRRRARVLGDIVRRAHGKMAVFSNTWHFAPGLGNPHPRENGLAWHPTLGVPYLAGSSVKGMVRSAFENRWVDLPDNGVMDRWFGRAEDPDRKLSDQVGEWCFFEALPIEPVRLCVDVMTVHYGSWYKNDQQAGKPLESQAPGDWDTPVPIQFLAADRVRLLVAVAPRSGQPDADLDRLWDGVMTAFSVLGAGAKTAVGYGQFAVDASQTQALFRGWEEAIREEEQAQRLETISDPLSQDVERYVMQETSKDPTRDRAAILFNALTQDKWVGLERARIAQELKALMEVRGKWKLESHRKRPEKDHDVRRSRTVQRWIDEGGLK